MNNPDDERPDAPPEGGAYDAAGGPGAAADAAAPATFAARVTYFRERAGLSQAALARATALSPGAISMIEADARTPSVQTAGAIARALGVSLADLVGEPVPGVDGLRPEDDLFFRDFARLPDALRDEMRAYLEFVRAKRRGGPSGGA